MSEVKVTTKEPMLLEWWSENYQIWFGVTDERFVGQFRARAERFLMNNPERYVYFHEFRIKVSYYEGGR